MNANKTLKSFAEISAEIEQQFKKKTAQSHLFQEELLKLFSQEIRSDIKSLSIDKTELCIVLKTIAHYNRIKHQRGYFIKSIKQKFKKNQKINIETLRIEVLE